MKEKIIAKTPVTIYIYKTSFNSTCFTIVKATLNITRPPPISPLTTHTLHLHLSFLQIQILPWAIKQNNLSYQKIIASSKLAKKNHDGVKKYCTDNTMHIILFLLNSLKPRLLCQ